MGYACLPAPAQALSMHETAEKGCGGVCRAVAPYELIYLPVVLKTLGSKV
jgi:hypothetical protein